MREPVFGDKEGYSLQFVLTARVLMLVRRGKGEFWVPAGARPPTKERGTPRAAARRLRRPRPTHAAGTPPGVPPGHLRAKVIVICRGGCPGGGGGPPGGGGGAGGGAALFNLSTTADARPPLRGQRYRPNF